MFTDNFAVAHRTWFIMRDIIERQLSMHGCITSCGTGLKISKSYFSSYLLLVPFYGTHIYSTSNCV